MVDTRATGVFRTKPNIYDESYLQEQLTAFSHYLFFPKIAMVDV